MKPLYSVSIRAEPGTEELLIAMIEASAGAPPCAYTDAETGLTKITSFQTRLPMARNLARSIKTTLISLRAQGDIQHQPRIILQTLPPQDWAESWKKHFKPLLIAHCLLIRPSWCRPPAGRSIKSIVLDPGLSFGTGHHPTTEFCLEQLIRARKPNARQSLLDIGTGSGILAIAAAKFGFQPIRAIDFDPAAVRVASQNARRNRVHKRLTILRKSVETLDPTPGLKHCFAVVCANLQDDLLIAHARGIAAQLDPGGVLILAGILRKQFAPVQAAYERLGLRLIRARSQREWRSGAFQFSAVPFALGLG